MPVNLDIMATKKVTFQTPGHHDALVSSSNFLSEEITACPKLLIPNSQQSSVITNTYDALFQVPKVKFQDRHSPPFRPGGRGSKMLAKAIEQDLCGQGIDGKLVHENQLLNEFNSLTFYTNSLSEPTWVLCSGKTPCFAKVVSAHSSVRTLCILTLETVFYSLYYIL